MAGMSDETQAEKFRRLGDTSESIVRALRQFGDMEAALRFWDALDPADQRMVAIGFASMIAEYRSELEHPIDAHYGFPIPPPSTE
jgi:hypothetical protein